MPEPADTKRLAKTNRPASVKEPAAAPCEREDELARRPDDVAVLLDIANQLAELEREEEAVLHLRRGIDLARTEASQELLARLHYTLGGIQQSRGEIDDAVEQFRLAAPLADRTNSAHEAFFARMGQSLVDLERKDFGAVEKLLEEARAYAGPDAPVKRRLLFHTRHAEYLAATGHPGRAEAEYREAVEIASKGLDTAEGLVALHRLSEFHRQLGRLEKAEQVFREAVQMAADTSAAFAPESERGDRESEANALVWLAWRNLEAERLDEAEECARGARAAARKVEIAHTRRDAEHMLARIREKRGA